MYLAGNEKKLAASSSGSTRPWSLKTDFAAGFFWFYSTVELLWSWSLFSHPLKRSIRVVQINFSVSTTILYETEDLIIIFGLLERMYRRFVNLVSHDLGTHIYSLHRVDLWKHLFYRSTAEARAAAEKKRRRELLHKIKSSWLPGPEINFRGSQTKENCGFDYWFSLLGGEDSRILFADNGCQTALYNADLKGIGPMPNTHSRKGPNPICLSMPQVDRAGSQSLYIMDTSGDSCFEVLTRSRNDLSSSTSREDWCWHTLPRPPFRFESAFKVSNNMCPHSVVDSRTICVSSSLEDDDDEDEDEGIGSQQMGSTYMYKDTSGVWRDAGSQMGSTYTYDTVSSVWRKAGNWVLPFIGKAEYVPELNLWFGLRTCKRTYRLCAFDLSAMDYKQPPMPQHTWDVFDVTEERPASHVHLVNLGAGRFCIATFFEPMLDEEENILEEELVVLTGVEVKRKVDEEATLMMTEHMSECFSLGLVFVL